MWHRSILLSVSLVAAAFAADDGWGKVKAVPNGTEVRVTKIGARFGVIANVYEVTDESIIVTTKTEQISFAKDQIVKIESRPFASTSRVTRSSTVDNTPLNREAARPTPGPSRTPGPSGSASSGLHVSGKEAFNLVWTRPKRN
ncbi:MAG: hypothetical protein HYX27_01745 [Acidobacteria bacterium]|nr:hypothetical protein [Acidobacteriota bacterium]